MTLGQHTDLAAAVKAQPGAKSTPLDFIEFFQPQCGNPREMRYAANGAVIPAGLHKLKIIILPEGGYYNGCGGFSDAFYAKS